jgi:hypothetical protein
MKYGIRPGPLKNYLFDALIARIEQAPLQWHLIVTIGQLDDPTELRRSERRARLSKTWFGGCPCGPLRQAA